MYTIKCLFVKLLLLAWGWVACSGHVLAQDNKYEVALGYGFYRGPDFPRLKSKDFISGDFNYRIAKRWTIGSGFMWGKYDYFENVRANVFPEPKDGPTATNGNGYESHTYIKATYLITHSTKFLFQAGVGVGLLTRRLKYPYAGPSSSDDRIFISEESISRFEVPLKIEFNYLIAKWIGIGFEAGTYLQTDIRLLGTYVGPQIVIHL